MSSLSAPGAQRASAHTDTQRQAEQRAVGIVGNLSGSGEVIAHRSSGVIRDSNTINRRDPNPPKG